MSTKKLFRSADGRFASPKSKAPAKKAKSTKEKAKKSSIMKNFEQQLAGIKLSSSKKKK